MRLKFFAIFIVLFFGVYLYRFSVPVWALSCVPPIDSYIVVCSNSSCKDGFQVQQKSTGNWCSSREIVVEDKKKVLDFVLEVTREKGWDLSEGIYEIKVLFGCGDLDHEWCISAIEAEQLTRDLDKKDLDFYRSEWKRRELISLFSVLLIKWVVFLAVWILFGYLLVWPWRKFKQGEVSLGEILKVSLFVRLPLIFIFILFFMWSYSLWSGSVLIAGVIFLISFVGEAGYWLYKRFYKK